MSHPALGAPLRVKGTVRASAVTVAWDDRVEVTGVVGDEVGRPLPKAELTLRVRSLGRLARLSFARSCGSSRLTVAGTDLNLQADGEGRFCVELPPELDGVVELVPRATDYLASVTSEVSIDRRRRHLALNLSASTTKLDLAAHSHILHVDTQVTPPFGVDESPPQIALVLALETGTGVSALKQLATRPGERVQVEVASADFGGPGAALLRLSYEGGPVLRPAEAELAVERVAAVRLEFQSSASTVGTSFEASLLATTASGPAPGGAVEVRQGPQVLALAPIREGVARVHFPLEPRPAAGVIRLEFRFVPATPYLRPGPPLLLELEPTKETSLGAVPWLAGALLVTGWVLFNLRRPGAKLRAQGTPDAPGQPPHGAGLEVVREGEPASGWQGAVTDAHSGAPIVSARLEVHRVAFIAEGPQATAVTGSDGRFHLESEGLLGENLSLLVVAPWHRPLKTQLPLPGQLAVRLLSRKRALLESLVAWARRQGQPWSARGEPTPGHVARIAERHLANDVALWAKDVQAAAFDAGEVDERKDSEIAAAEPRA